MENGPNCGKQQQGHKSITKHFLDSMGIGPIAFDCSPLETILNRIGPRLTEPHRHDYYEIIWFTGGSGTHWIEFASYEIKPDTLICLGRNQIHAFREISGMQGYMLRFSEKFIDPPYQGGLAGRKYSLFDAGTLPIRTIPGEKRAMLLSLIELIDHESKLETAVLHETMLFHLLNVFMHEVERLETGEHRSSPARQHIMQSYNAFFSLLEQHYGQQHRVEFYAKSLKLTPKRLNELCREATGVSTKKIIEERVILEAKRYLHHSDLSIKEICYQLGFEDPAYFSRVFTKVAAASPSAFRNRQVKKYQ